MKISNIIKNKIVQESGMLFISQCINIVINGFIFMILRPNLLSPYEIGLISYINSIITTMANFFNFGLDNTGSRLILQENDPEKKKKIAGMTFFLAIIICIAFSFIIYLVSFLIPYFGDAEAVPLIRLIIPFSAYSILQFFIINICYAFGKIKAASIITMSFSLIYLPVIFVLNNLQLYTVKVALFSEYFLQMIVPVVALIIIGKKYIKIFKELWAPIKKENKEVGIKVYLARIIFLPSFDLDKLILGAFYSLETVGFYTIAKMLAGPTIVFGQSIAQSLYRRHTEKDKIPRQVIVLTLISIIITALLVLLCGYIIINYFLKNEYRPVLLVLPFAVIAAAINGYIAIFTSFMDAKGMANEVRNVAIVGMVLSVVLNFSLIIPFGMIGGMISRIVVLLVILVMRIYYCLNYSKKSRAITT